MLSVIDFVTDDQDALANAIIRSAHPQAFLDTYVNDAESLRLVPQLAVKCDEQRAAALSSPALRKSQLSITNTAKNGIIDANTSLTQLETRTKTIIDEHQTATTQLEQFVNSFETLSSAKQRLSSVEKCRKVADAYARVLNPLNLYMRDGSLADMNTVAANIETLIETVQDVRGKSSTNKNRISNDLNINNRIISAVEKRAVDAVIKARAAFINVLDNEFRQFGWPMKVPVPGINDQLISNVKTYVNQLNLLQRVSNDGDFIHERTKSRRAHSDNWAVAAILRTPLARFKYHFLENISQSQQQQNSSDIGTSRFDRPEWAAEFALERIRETTPFLSEIQIDGPHTADVKFAEGFCLVFADKIAYDCELALRTVKNDSDADILIAHASDTAKQFDNTLRSGILSLKDRKSDAPLFQSSLHVLSLNESYLTTWASSELRLALTQVNALLQRALGKSREEIVEGESNQTNMEVVNTREELEQICSEIVSHIGSASQKCRSFESGERISKFLKLTETPLLQTIRSRLKEDIENEGFEDVSIDEIRRCGRAALCAMLLSEALEDRSVDTLYVSQEERLGQGFYDDDITRLRTLYSSTCALLSESIANTFMDKVRSGYGQSTRFGEVWAPDAAFVLTHDLSEPLIEPLTTLEKSLSAMMVGVPCRRSASLIWRPVANKLDYFFFDEVVLQCFIGGTRNAMPAASEQNGFLTADSCARMARQVASDVETFVTAFSVVSANPSQFLPHSSECVSILQIASNSLLLPSISSREEDEELLEAIHNVAENPDDEDSKKRVETILETRLNAIHICARDALELVAITGHRSAIRLT